MRVAIVGAGAIGGLMGVNLALAGHEVSVLGRGPTLAALQRAPWRLDRDGDTVEVAVKAAADAAELGPQDLVVLAVKGPALAALAPTLAPLLRDDTAVLPAMNGVPWWFLLDGAGELGSARLGSVDPDGAIEAAIARERVVGCVVHASATVIAPGVVAHMAGNGLIVGEPFGPVGGRLEAVAAALADAGFAVTRSAAIRTDIWYKLWGNMTINPLATITGATADRVLDDPLIEAFVLGVMTEAQSIGALIGCRIVESGADRNAMTRRLGAFRPSMLQDADAGRTLELDQLLGAPREIASLLGLATPNLDTLFGIARLTARIRGLYPDALPQMAK